MNEQPKDGLQIITCLRCGGAMFQCAIENIGGTRLGLIPIRLTLIPADKGSVLDRRKSYLVSLVCENCGYTELHATNIDGLKPKQ